jgi:hypothetical protein
LRQNVKGVSMAIEGGNPFSSCDGMVDVSR